MQTKCFCIFCPRHPKFKDRHLWNDPPTGFLPGDIIWGADEYAAKVECLLPVSSAFEEFNIDPNYQEFPITAYGDGCAMTGFSTDGITVFASCHNEDYEE